MGLLRLRHHLGGARVETVEDGHDLLFALGVEHGKEGVADGIGHCTVCGQAKPSSTRERRAGRVRPPQEQSGWGRRPFVPDVLTGILVHFPGSPGLPVLVILKGGLGRQGAVEGCGLPGLICLHPRRFRAGKKNSPPGSDPVGGLSLC